MLGRYKLFVDCTDHYIAPHLIFDGYWEMWVTQAIARLLRAGDTAIDVGANYGYFSLLMAARVGLSGRVHAFEPNPPIHELLSRTITTNGVGGRVKAHRLGLGAAEGEAELVVPPNGPGGARVRAPVAGQPMVGAPIQIRRLDSDPEWVEADLVKIDAEGAEADIWAGMTGLLRGSRLKTVIVEFTAGRYADPQGFLRELTGHGFRLYELTSARGPRRVSEAHVLAQDPMRDQMLLLRR